MDASSDDELDKLLKDYNKRFVIPSSSCTNPSEEIEIDAGNLNTDNDFVSRNQKKVLEGMQINTPGATSNVPRIDDNRVTMERQQRPNSRMISKNNISSNVIPDEQTYCQVQMTTMCKLKDSTKKLLDLLEQIKRKTISIKPGTEVCTPKIAKPIKPLMDNKFQLPKPADLKVFKGPELSQLEAQTNQLKNIMLEDEDDDCSIYKRLTRKCHCLNKQEYNDFIIHFNESPKYLTNNIGEVIKNLRILKKFLYLGNNYTKNALMFLNEGLQECSYSEKVEITQGCAHADVCNVFEEHSLAICCISWPFKYEYFGDTVTQSYAATFINQLAQIEEGRRYLNYTSRVKNDIKKIIRKKGSQLDIDVLESLNSTMKLLQPSIAEENNCTVYYNRIDEGFGYRTIQHLCQYRHYMTLDEILTYLELLKRFSTKEKGKAELKLHLYSILSLFIMMLNEYNDSEMNIIITVIINNIVSEREMKKDTPKTIAYASIATEAIKMRSEFCQIPEKKKPKRRNRTRVFLGLTHSKFKQKSRRRELNNMIIVPLEKE